MRAAAGAQPGTPAAWFDRGTLRRVISDLLADQRALVTRRTVPAADILGWSDATRLDEDGIGFGSLALLEAAQRANEFFHLHEVGIEDYLFVRRTLGGWLDIVEQSLSTKAERLTFRTSGSTGEPKRVTHPLALLAEEAAYHAGELRRFGVRRIVSLVPSHHIYGFLFTALLPAEGALPICDARRHLLSLRRHLSGGDAVIATPFLWSLLARQPERFPEGVVAVTSTAPMPGDVRTALGGLGLETVYEIYGSSETAGVGVRTRGDEPFRLLPYWRRDGGSLSRISSGFAPLVDLVEPPDEFVWSGQDRFVPVGRVDGAVQIGGVNVHPQRIADLIAQHADVEECHVARVGVEAEAQLVALVVPRAGARPDLVEVLDRYAADHLSPPERPASYRVMPALPRNALGKVLLSTAV